MRVAGRVEDELKTFYTSLYHSLMHPNTFNDADGRYIGFDDKVRTLPEGRTQYANYVNGAARTGGSFAPGPRPTRSVPAGAGWFSP
ncbi:glycoside hydrolase domain-containing protein [Streptomyces sp. NPDC091387]|uniref:glycoside hydrolase domain-containing protein n=1 Tax=Streptomyces sp. NPDC091387 TaxID=3365998 RepID=UPI0037F301F5